MGAAFRAESGETGRVVCAMGDQAQAISRFRLVAIPYPPSGFEPGGGTTGRLLALDPAGDLVKGRCRRRLPALARVDVAVNLQAALAAQPGCLRGEGLHLVGLRGLGCLGCDLVALLHCCSFAGIQTREGCRAVCWWRTVALRARRRRARCSAAGDVGEACTGGVLIWQEVEGRRVYALFRPAWGWQDIEARRVTRFPGRPGSLASPGRSAGPRLLMRGVWLIELPAS